jgi:hypothetical protein
MPRPPISSNLADWSRLADEWRERTEAVQNKIAREAAKALLGRVKKGIPSKPEYKDYRDSLQTFQLTSGSAFGVRINPRSKKVKKLDPTITLIYIKSKVRTRKEGRATRLLEKLGPWTVTTLPFLPSKKEASIVYRKVTRKEVDAVEKLKAQNAGKIRRAFIRINVDVERARKKNANSDAVPDVAFLGNSLEFGYGKTRATPHWRPALKFVLRNSVPALLASPDIRSALTDVNYTNWKLWNKQSEPMAPDQDKDKFKAFMLRVQKGT